MVIILHSQKTSRKSRSAVALDPGAALIRALLLTTLCKLLLHALKALDAVEIRGSVSHDAHVKVLYTSSNQK